MGTKKGPEAPQECPGAPRSAQDCPRGAQECTGAPRSIPEHTGINYKNGQYKNTGKTMSIHECPRSTQECPRITQEHSWVARKNSRAHMNELQKS